MSLYKRGGVWWYEFTFAGQRIRGSSKSASKTVARDAEHKRRRDMEEGLHGIRKRRAWLLSTAAEEWLDFKRPHLAPRSVEIEEANLEHLKPVFGKTLLGDISAEGVSRYQAARLGEGASPKTVNLEVGTLRAILRRNRLWANLQPDVKMLRVRDDVGQAITLEEEDQLLGECSKSRSRSLHPAVTLALSTGMRYSEIRLLTWAQVDLSGRHIQVGASKTEYGEGRSIPMNERAFQVMSMWAEAFPNRQPEHYVFPAEKYGLAQREDQKKGSTRACVHSTDPAKPIGSWKEAWESARKRAGLSCRFHDLRHTSCTRMLESGTPLSVVATIMGWSPSTTVRMSRRYGHIGQAAQREAVKALEGKSAKIGGDSPQNRPQFQTEAKSASAN